MPPFKAGYRRYPWHDRARDRPVWADLWYPADPDLEEQAGSEGLGGGSVVPDAEFASQGAPFPLIVLSHGASGSASNYGWLAEYLCRSGIAVLGVSHYGESWVYGAATIDPAAVTRLWLRPADCSFALDALLGSDVAASVDRARIGALGHSSGGATAVSLGGAIFDPAALRAYCASAAAALDLGCRYGREGDAPSLPDRATRSHRDARVGALVLVDPAAGPAFSASTLRRVTTPVLVIG